MKRTALLATLAMALTTGLAQAESWKLDGSNSRLGFGSVKNHYNGEAHSITGLSGTVTDGKAEIMIDLSTVQTNIDIRNERMVEHVFKNAPAATLTADLDMKMLSRMSAGDTNVLEVEATLSFLDQDVDIYTEMFVARMSDDRVLVTTNDMLYIATDELGIDGGINMLQELASLDDITRSVPVTLRMVFDLQDTAS
ncbi:MAG: YceI family protein [Pseudomonadota bacterium]